MRVLMEQAPILIHTSARTGRLAASTVRTAVPPTVQPTIRTPERTPAALRPTDLMGAGVRARPTIRTPVTTPPPGKVRAPMVHGGNPSFPTETNPPTPNIILIPEAP